MCGTGGRTWHLLLQGGVVLTTVLLPALVCEGGFFGTEGIEWEMH